MSVVYIRPNKQRRILPFVLIFVLLIISIVLFIIEESYAKQLKEHFSDVLILEHNRNPFIILLSFANLLVYILAIIYYVRWFQRAYHNIEQFNVSLPYSKKWSALGWFIPLVHWIIPIRIMVHLYKSTEQLLVLNTLGVKKKSRYMALSIWWTLYVCSGVSSIYILFFVHIDRFDEQDVLWSFNVGFYTNLIDIALIIYALLVVYNYGQMEDQLLKIPSVEKEKNQHSDLLDAGLSDVTNSTF